MLGAVLSTVAGVVYVYLGRRLAARRVAGASRGAAYAFAVWWVGLGTITLVSAAFNVVAGSGYADLPLVLTFTYVVFLALYVTLAALCHYLVYVYTGHSRWLGAVVAFYAGLYMWSIWLITTLGPSGVVIDRWSVKLDYVRDLAPGDPLTQVFLVLFLGPPILAALAYATLWFRVRDPTSRWRIGLVSGCIVVWFGASAVASGLNVNQSDEWQVLSRLVGLSAAGVVLLAYFPPRWARTRFGVASLADEVR